MPDIEQLTSKMLGDYRVERLLGQSQLGAAYLAVESTRGVKAMVTTFVFPEGQAIQEREQFRARFAAEGSALTRLVHAHILPVYAFGEGSNYFYLVTAFVKEASLGQMLKQNTRLTPRQALYVLRQLASALDYAHVQGIAHGMLSLANVIVNERLETSIAGFGLRTMLEIHGNRQSSRPLAHLSSAHGAFLGSPEYIAPERVLGLVCDWRVDIYALGVITFALLSGVPPFCATTPLDTALQRLQQPVPPVHVICPDVPEAFDLVIGRALERDSARRFQSAGELLAAFERVLNAQDAASQASAPDHQAGQLPPGTRLTMPPTVDWFDEQFTPSGRWQVAPTIGTEQMRALNNAPLALPGTLNPHNTAVMRDSREEAAVFPFAQSLASSPYNTDIMRASTHLSSVAGGSAPLEKLETRRLRDNLVAPGSLSNNPVPAAAPRISGASLAGIDPFAWWSSHAGGRKQPLSAAPVPARHLALPLAASGNQKRGRPDQRGRRKIVTLAVASVAAAGALSIGGITFARLAQSIKQSPQSANLSGTIPTGGTTPTQPAQPTARPTAGATRAPAHTGTVIGSTRQAANSAQVFHNPADGVSSLLIRLSNGTFVACERTCPHRGVLVDYDQARKLIVCPAHDAVFDPRHGFSHLSGPGSGPLPRVTIHVNDDGTVTSG
ncbi:MAG TPA: protein kinase [Ktedonobacteraceae bacterium]